MSEDASQDEKTFATVDEVLEYLDAGGWVAKSATVYRHRKQGKFLPQDSGQFRQKDVDRWPVPQGKDPGEAFAMGTDLDRWIWAGMPPALTIEGPGEARAAIPETKTPPNDAEAPSGVILSAQLPASVMELRELLRKNPGVRIVNTPERFAVLRDGKYVGGRINRLVFQDPAVRDYLLGHPAVEINWENLIA